jgi:hypothetical protein
MEPGTIAIVLGTAFSAMGQLQAGANAQANANTNATGLFQLANADRLKGVEDRKRQRRLAGKNRAIDPDKLDLLEDNAIEGALIEADITHAAEIQALSRENRGRAQIALGKQARAQSVFGAFSTALIGFGTAALPAKGTTNLLSADNQAFFMRT